MELDDVKSCHLVFAWCFNCISRFVAHAQCAWAIGLCQGVRSNVWQCGMFRNNLTCPTCGDQSKSSHPYRNSWDLVTIWKWADNPTQVTPSVSRVQAFYM